MTQEKQARQYIPVLTINNTKEKQEVEIGGELQEVEIPAKEGFNIETRDPETNKFQKEFLTEKLEGVILLAKHEIRSKFESKDFFFSNEFEYDDNDNIRVYAPIKKEVLFEGTYEEAQTHFDTGQKTKGGYPIREYDVYLILYLLYDGQIYRYRQKMNQNCNWFEYKKNFTGKDYHTHTTKFALSKKTAGSNTFWVCEYHLGEETDRAEMEKKQDELLEALKEQEYKPKTSEAFAGDDIKIDKIPF